MSPQEIVKKLAAFSHRGAASEFEPKVLDFLTQLFDNQVVMKENFRTPKTYISVVWWLVGGIAFGLVLLNFLPIWGMIFTLIFVLFSFLYFNWFPSIITKFPPLVTSHNLVIREKKFLPKAKKLILMAHYDSAPISFLYRPDQVKNFRISLNISLFLMFLAGISSIIYGFQILDLHWLTNILAAYFILQGITGTIDFFRFGYSNGASDNATGVAAAIETAKKLWQNPAENLEIELVLTGAEEAGMIGARAYFLKHKTEFNDQTYLINFDTLGNGKLKVITETGSLFNIKYENKLTKIASEIISQSADYQRVTTGAWHTADFDSVWFQRAGISCLTLAALDENGRMPNIHRPTDTIENVDFSPMNLAIKLAEEIAKNLI